MNLQCKKVTGIPEPVKLVSATGFAVGANTNQVYVWHASYQQADQEAEVQPEDQRLDGVDEEYKGN